MTGGEREEGKAAFPAGGQPPGGREGDAAARERAARFLAELGKAYQALAMYGPSHPAISGRLSEVCREGASIAEGEPGRRLLLGVARDRFLYRDTFLPATLRSTAALAEALYLRQVATLSLSPALATEGLATLFASLREGRAGEEGALPPWDRLVRAGFRGIRVSPLNYKELFSGEEDGEGPAPGGSAREREEALWRMLLTADVAGGEEEEGAVQELAESPALVALVLSRARRSHALGAAVGREEGEEDGAPSPELLRRVFRRLGDTMGTLDPERRETLLSSLEEGMEGEAGLPPLPPGVVEAIRTGLSEDRSDGEMLDLLGAVLAFEEKGGKRLGRVFDLLAEARPGDSLLAAMPDRVRESLRTKDYYAVRTWETLEKLLLQRTEDRYIGGDHGEFLEAVAGSAAPRGVAGTADPALASAFDGVAVRARSALVILELLWREQEAAPFAALLEDVRKIVPVLVSRGDLALLSTVLFSLGDLRGASSGERARAVDAALAATDFGLLVDALLARHDAAPESDEAVGALFARFAAAAAPSLLGRLLVEDDAPRRRRLLDLSVRVGEGMVPFVLERMGHPKWYFVRNLCWILGEVGVRRGIPGLFRSLQHEEHRVRREAIAALGKMRAPEAVEPLGKILLSESFLSGGRDDAVRVEAATALFHVGGSEALGLLHRGVRSRRPAVREQCERLLGHGGGGTR